MKPLDLSGTTAELQARANSRCDDLITLLAWLPAELSGPAAYAMADIAALQAAAACSRFKDRLHARFARGAYWLDAPPDGGPLCVACGDTGSVPIRPRSAHELDAELPCPDCNTPAGGPNGQ